LDEKLSPGAGTGDFSLPPRAAWPTAVQFWDCGPRPGTLHSAFSSARLGKTAPRFLSRRKPAPRSTGGRPKTGPVPAPFPLL